MYPNNSKMNTMIAPDYFSLAHVNPIRIYSMRHKISRSDHWRKKSVESAWLADILGRLSHYA